jgi:hypothetical protein
MSDYFFYANDFRKEIYRKFKDIPTSRLPKDCYAVPRNRIEGLLGEGYSVINIKPRSVGMPPALGMGYGVQNIPRHYRGLGYSGLWFNEAAEIPQYKYMKEGKMSKGSKDRVKFRLLGHYFDKPAATEQLLRDSFGMNAEQIHKIRRESNAVREELGGFRCYAEIICRPSQFARFLIMREKAGFQNMFKELQAELFTPEPPAPPKIEPIDVSSNPSAR